MNISILKSTHRLDFSRKVLFYLGLFLALSTFVVSTKAVLANELVVDGRLWAFSFVIPASEASLKINLGDWVNGSSGISPGSNIQIYSPQSSNAADADSVITINNASAYSGKLNLVPRSGDDKVVRVIVQAYNFADSSRTGTVMPTAEYVDDKGHTVTVQASGNVPVATPVLTTINIASTTVSLTVGETQQLTAETLDQFGNPIDTELSWVSDNAGVATVDSTGLVTAVSLGTANVTASSGSTTSNMSVITVASSTEQPTSIEATSSDQTIGNPVSTTTINTIATSTPPIISSTSTSVIAPIATSTDTEATSTGSSSTPVISQPDLSTSSSTPSSIIPDVSPESPIPAIASSTPVTIEDDASDTLSTEGSTTPNP